MNDAGVDQAKPENQSFLGDTDNAVMTQVMVALCVYPILAYVKFQARVD